MSERAVFIARVESAIVHALDELEQAVRRGDPDEQAHLRGHVAGLKQALNLLKEPT